MLPVTTGSCPTCRSEEVRMLSTSPATGEVFNDCESCGEQWWEEVGSDDLDEKVAA